VERIVLNSGLEGFILLDEIQDAGADSITAGKLFDLAPAYLCIEAMAQLGAYHVRYIGNFERHAFLLGVKRCSLPAEDLLSGYFRLHGKLESRSSSAFSYLISATGENGTEMEGEFLFAAVDYDGAALRREILRPHYEKVFACLRSGSKKNC